MTEILGVDFLKKLSDPDRFNVVFDYFQAIREKRSDLTNRDTAFLIKAAETFPDAEYFEHWLARAESFRPNTVKWP